MDRKEKGRKRGGRKRIGKGRKGGRAHGKDAPWRPRGGDYQADAAGSHGLRLSLGRVRPGCVDMDVA